jgi:hypothetical protein
MYAEAMAAIHGLRLAGRNRDVRGFLDFANRLIGLGPGLTPSGDDFLTGFMLATACLARVDGGVAAWYDGAGQALASRSAQRTTLAGSNQLWLASRGEADEVVCRAVTAILWEDRELRASVEALLQTGSSSGGDILAGICVAAEP